MAKPTLHIEIFVDYRLVLREPVGLDDAALLGGEHIDLCARADRAGFEWRVELTDPEGDIEPLVLTNRPESPGALPAEEGIARALADPSFRPPIPTHLPMCPSCRRRILDAEERDVALHPRHRLCRTHERCYILCDHDDDGFPVLERL